MFQHFDLRRRITRGLSLHLSFMPPSTDDASLIVPPQKATQRSWALYQQQKDIFGDLCDDRLLGSLRCCKNRARQQDGLWPKRPSRSLILDSLSMNRSLQRKSSTSVATSRCNVKLPILTFECYISRPFKCQVGRIHDWSAFEFELTFGA